MEWQSGIYKMCRWTLTFSVFEALNNCHPEILQQSFAWDMYKIGDFLDWQNRFVARDIRTSTSGVTAVPSAHCSDCVTYTCWFSFCLLYVSPQDSFSQLITCNDSDRLKINIVISPISIYPKASCVYIVISYVAYFFVDGIYIHHLQILVWWIFFSTGILYIYM